MRASADELVCVLLDDEGECRLWKSQGLEALPSACRSFPFSLVRDPDGRVRIGVSRACSAVIAGEGEPVENSVERFWDAAKSAEPLAARFGLKSGRTLAPDAYLSIAALWGDLIEECGAPEGLVRAYERTESVENELPRGEVGSGELRGVWAEGGVSENLVAGSEGLLTRLFFAQTLAELTAPGHLRGRNSVRAPTFWTRLGALWTSTKILLGIGKVRLWGVGFVSLRKVRGVPSPLSGPLAGEFARFLAELISRRKLFVRQTYLHTVLIELAFTLLVASRYARARAAQRRAAEVEREDLGPAFALADRFLAAQLRLPQGMVLSNLRMRLLTDPKAFRAFLASEL